MTGAGSTIHRSQHAHTVTCMCGGVMVRKVDTITRVIRGKEIRIHNAPYYECLACGEIEFDLNDRISSITVEAYRDGKTDVVWVPQEA